MTILASKGKNHLCQYECGLYTVDKITKSVGMTLFASENYDEVKRYFDSLN